MKQSENLFDFEQVDESKQEVLVAFDHSSKWRDLKKSFRNNRVALIGMILLGIILLLAIIMPLTIPYSDAIDPTSDVNLLPGEYGEDGKKYLFGTDSAGRDLWARVWYGISFSLLLGFITTTISITVGTVVGLLMGYYYNLGKGMLFLVKVFSSLPVLLILILFNVALGSSIGVMILGLTIVSWIVPSQQVRADVLVNKNLDFITASKTLGTKNYKILWTLFMFSIPTIINQFIILFPKLILYEATIGFLGLSIPDIPILGNIINDGKDQIFTYPHQLFIPVSFLVVSIISMQMFAGGIQDAFKLTKVGDF